MYPRPRYDDCMRYRIEAYCKSSTSNASIAKRLRISVRTVDRYRQLIAVFGSVDRPPLPDGRTSLTGRPRSIHTAGEEALVQYISDCSQSPTLDEMQTYLAEEFNIDTSLSTISRCLKRLDITHKKGSRVHPSRDSQLRGEFYIRMADYKAS